MSCADFTESLNALLDGELSPQQAATLSSHLAHCPACTQTLAELAELRAGLAQLVPEADVPAELQARIEALLADEASRVVPFKPSARAWLPNRAGWIAAAVAIAAALMLAFIPRHDETKDLMSVRDAALRGGPAVYASASYPAVEGFKLIRSRTDEVAGHLAQVADYTRGSQTITLCIWPANGEPAHGIEHADYRGMAISYWNDGRNEYWAASATPGAGLQDFVAALKGGFV